jgi:O-methyltransferase
MTITQIKDRILYGQSVDPNNIDYKTRLTMLPRKFLENIESCVNETLENNIEGDFVEAGVWQGGACILAHNIFKIASSTKKVWVFDSFEGLPKPDAEKYPSDAGDTHWTIPELSVSLEQVQANFSLFNELDNSVEFVKGWFKDTMPNNKVKTISVLRLDGDMYESTIEPLEFLYPKLSKGGYCIIDDYTPEYGAFNAVNDYRETHNITEPIEIVHNSGVTIGFWKKA